MVTFYFLTGYTIKNPDDNQIVSSTGFVKQPVKLDSYPLIVMINCL